MSRGRTGPHQPTKTGVLHATATLCGWRWRQKHADSYLIGAARSGAWSGPTDQVFGILPCRKEPSGSI